MSSLSAAIPSALITIGTATNSGRYTIRTIGFDRSVEHLVPNVGSEYERHSQVTQPVWRKKSDDPSHLERKFVTLYDGSILCRGERLWRIQVLEAGQSSRWC